MRTNFTPLRQAIFETLPLFLALCCRTRIDSPLSIPIVVLSSPVWGYRKELVLSKIRLRKDACNVRQAPDYKKRGNNNESSQIPSELYGAAAASASLPALASTTERFSTKQRPVDTMNRIEGWTQGKVKPVKVRNLMIGECRPKIFAPTTDKNEADMLKTLKNFSTIKALDMVEVRIDYLGRLSPAKFAEITKKAYEAAGSKAVLVTLRNGTDGGPFIAEDKYYGEVYEAIIRDGKADVIDIELFRDRAMIERLVKLAHAKGIKVIISEHEFKFTPDEAELIRRMQLEQAAGADILKIAVMANSPEDALTVMTATAKMRHYYSDRPMLTIGMGKWGAMTRLAGEGFGSDLTVASVGGKASAPGQIPADECLAVLDTLHRAMNP